MLIVILRGHDRAGRTEWQQSRYTSVWRRANRQVALGRVNICRHGSSIAVRGLLSVAGVAWSDMVLARHPTTEWSTVPPID